MTCFKIICILLEFFDKLIYIGNKQNKLPFKITNLHCSIVFVYSIIVSHTLLNGRLKLPGEGEKGD